YSDLRVRTSGSPSRRVTSTGPRSAVRKTLALSRDRSEARKLLVVGTSTIVLNVIRSVNRCHADCRGNPLRPGTPRAGPTPHDPTGEVQVALDDLVLGQRPVGLVPGGERDAQRGDRPGGVGGVGAGEGAVRDAVADRLLQQALLLVALG